MKERTLILFKPDAVQRGLIGEILSRFERCGLKVIGMKLIHATKTHAGEHYAADENWLISVGEKALKSAAEKGETISLTAKEIGQKVRQQLIDFISMSPSVAICLEGHNAIATVRKMVGPTSPEQALPGTIRGDYSHETYKMADQLNRPVQNLIHASGTVQEAEREIAIWFKKDELCTYPTVHEAIIYRKG